MTGNSAYIGISRQLAGRLLPLAIVIGLLISLGSPVTYWYIQHRTLQHLATHHAGELAAKLQRLAQDSPELWKYQTYKFMTIYRDFHPELELIGFGVLDEKGEAVTGYSSSEAWKKYGRKLTIREEIAYTLGSAPIVFNNRRLGTIEVLFSDADHIRNTLILFLISSIAGATLGIVIYRFPTSVVRALEGEIGELIANLRESDEKIRTLNVDLEKRVAEKTLQLLDAQEKLVRKEKMAILGQLSGSVGHELRNPLGVMNNAVYFLKMVNSEADEITKEYLDIIGKEIDNAQRIITDLLDFARTKTPQVRPVSVRELLNGTIDKCSLPGNVKLLIDVPDSLPQVTIDPLQMEQVLQNLATNAVQAMPEGGFLRITGSKLIREGLESEDFVAIGIEDTGSGISEENMNRLFQPLFTTKAKGIGLGLVVCRNLVEANSGIIEVESEPGKGTTFRVILPTGNGK